MIWYTYITEWLSQQIYWTSVISYRHRVKEIESKMFPPVLRICSLTFHVYHTAVFIICITSHTTCLVLTITGSLCLLTAFIPFPLPPCPAWSNIDLMAFSATRVSLLQQSSSLPPARDLSLLPRIHGPFSFPHFAVWIYYRLAKDRCVYVCWVPPVVSDSLQLCMIIGRSSFLSAVLHCLSLEASGPEAY